MKTLVTYKSIYGSSKQYALWIADALHCNAEEITGISLNHLLSYDIIIHVGGLYAGSISGINIIRKHLNLLKDKKLILCMAGMTNPVDKDRYRRAFESNIPKQYRQDIRTFALRGNQLFSKMSLIHRIMMIVPRAQVKKIPAEKRTEENRHFLENFGKDVCFVKREYIDGVIDYVRTLYKTPS